ncbi:MAG: DNA-directed DNA polymerase I, partial [Candidatus Bathyarchaeia archaeon]
RSFIVSIEKKMPSKTYTLMDFLAKKTDAEKRTIDEAPTEEEQMLKIKPVVSEEAKDIPPSYLVSATYDGERGAVCLKMYNEREQKIYLWYDNTGYKPYCLSDLPPEKVKEVPGIVTHPGFQQLEIVEKYDPLNYERKLMTKIIAKDPLSIGGRVGNSIRDILPKAWEADIKFHENYIFDRRLKVGMLYKVEDGKLIQVEHELPKEKLETIKTVFKDEPEEYMEYILRWLSMLELRVPKISRLAIDIEVAGEVATRVPNPKEAKDPIVAVSLIGSDGLRKVMLLKREGVEEGVADVDAEIEYFDSEKELVLKVFDYIEKYPFILTFNGDDFDLPYLYYRAKKLGIEADKIPIERGRDSTLIKNGIHIDLYKFFFNKSIQVYAFGQKYRENTLDEIGDALLGMGKVEIDVPISELTYMELAKYCLRDSQIVYGLTSMNNDLVMNLIMVLARITSTPVEDLTRQGISNWIRNMMLYEHRVRGWLIPRKEDLLAVKGKITTKAIIEGKKYRGGEVITPKPGVHFNVAVLDFQSMYPSIVRQYNISYETLNCNHPECRTKTVPGTTHWICIKERGMTSLLIGSLKDVRVKWYKPRSKDKNLPPEVREWYNVVQSSLKVILNASYGVFGAENFALYCPTVAEAITSIGRYVIMKTVEKAESLGVEVIYGDTDSLFLKSPTKNQIEELISWAEKELGMELDIDRVYRYVVLSSRKKNYLGVYQDGTVDVKGLTGKKRHIPEFIKDAFMEMMKILGSVNSPEDFEKAKENIIELYKDSYNKIKRGNVPIDKLAFKIMLSRPPEGYVKTTPQHVKAALLLKQRGVDVRAGDIISFVKVVTDPGVKPIQLIRSPSEIDSDKYIEYLESTFEQVLDALDIDLMSMAGSRSLWSFMPFKKQ